MTEQTGESHEGLLFLIDYGWRPTEDMPNPPLSALLGAWRVDADGNYHGKFQPNPVYVPSTPDSPLDPVDALLGLLARGEAVAEQLPDVLYGAMFGIALDEHGSAIVRPAPDGVPSVLVATAHPHRERVEAPHWRNVTLEQLAEALPPQGIDVLINPGAPTSMRVRAGVFRETAARAEAVLNSDPAR